MYIVQACTYLLSHDDLAVQKMSRCIWGVLYDNYSHDQNLHCVWLTIFGANTNMHNCVYLYIFIFVCVNCIFVQVCSLCMTNYSRDPRMPGFFSTFLQTLLSVSGLFTSIFWMIFLVVPISIWISVVPLDFIFVSIWISLLSIEISITGVWSPSSASSPWTPPSLGFSLPFGPWPFSHRRKSLNDDFH